MIESVQNPDPELSATLWELRHRVTQLTEAYDLLRADIPATVPTIYAGYQVYAGQHDPARLARADQLRAGVPVTINPTAQLEAQLAATLQTNARLIARVVDLEHEIAEAARVAATAARLVSHAESLAERTGGAPAIHPDHYRALLAAVAPYRVADTAQPYVSVTEAQ